MKSIRKVGIGLGLLLATSLVAGCAGGSGAADYIAYEPVVEYSVIETVVSEPEAEEIVEAEFTYGIFSRTMKLLSKQFYYSN